MLVGQHVCEPDVRIDVVELRGYDQATVGKSRRDERPHDHIPPQSEACHQRDTLGALVLDTVIPAEKYWPSS